MSFSLRHAGAGSTVVPFLILILGHLSSPVDGIGCYVCDGCQNEDYKEAPSDMMEICDFCAKITTTYYAAATADTSVRQCWVGEPEILGCTEEYGDHHKKIVCNCDTDLCNGASQYTSHPIGILIQATIWMVIYNTNI